MNEPVIEDWPSSESRQTAEMLYRSSCAKALNKLASRLEDKTRIKNLEAKCAYLEGKIKEHNEKVDRGCCSTMPKGLQCFDCPTKWKIDL